MRMISDAAQRQLDVAKKNGDADDHAFLERLTKGFRWQVEVATRLLVAGYAVQTQCLEIRPDRSAADDYGDEYDLMVSQFPEDWIKHIEVKSRSVFFSDDPASFKWPTIFVERWETYEKRNNPPDYWIMISQKTSGCIVFPGRRASEDGFKEVKRGHEYLVAPKESFISFQEMLDEFPT